jgi:putative ABC transport system permease protein
VPVAQVRDSYMELNSRFMPLSWVVRTKVAPFSVSAPIRSMDQIVSGPPRAISSIRWSWASLPGWRSCSPRLVCYGLMAYSVQQRTLEFGIRLALGTDTPMLRNMVVRQAMLLAGEGIVAGLAAAYGLTRLMTSLLFSVKPTDPVVFASVTLLFAAVAFLASYLPARRALRVDPLVALRYE